MGKASGEAESQLFTKQSSQEKLQAKLKVSSLQSYEELQAKLTGKTSGGARISFRRS